jgi:hypothetical protein
MIVDTWLKRGIKGEGNQVEFGKQGDRTRLSLVMSPTSKYFLSKMESPITVRNAHPYHLSRRSLSAPPA